MNVIKAIREIVAGLGLKEAKDLVDAAPKVVKEGASKEEAAKIKEKLKRLAPKLQSNNKPIWNTYKREGQYGPFT